ncbi:MAG: PRC-barrel domain-containing protein [Planctomycetales bacterium]|nr:PRC-barrel domain-containing protein [Planctomycetales bacterium]
MKRNWKKMLSGLSLIAAIAFAAPVSAGPPAAEPAQPKAETPRAELSKVDETSGGSSIRVSQLIGMNVRNEANREIGEIEDVVLDAQTGKTRYVALSFGGFLGLGDKLFAIPWNNLECKPGADAGEYYLVLNLDERSLEKAPGFDQNHWPDFSDKAVTEQLDQYYGSGTHIRAGNIEIDVNRR